jgi:murein DD-endopeptidase MepM/ murein hydrolase activator NlpD
MNRLNLMNARMLAIKQQAQVWAALRPQALHLGPRAKAAVFGTLALCVVSAFAVAPMIADEPAPPQFTLQTEYAITGLAEQAEALDAAGVQLSTTRRSPGSSDTPATLNGLLSALGVQDAEAAAYLRGHDALRKLFARTTQQVSAKADDDGTLQSLKIRSLQLALAGQAGSVNVTDTLIERSENGFVSEQLAVPVSTHVRLQRGIIRSSLFAAADEIGMPDNVTVQLAEIFSGDIDFARDLRRGDEFHVLYEVLTADGEELRTGRLLGAVFVNKGMRHEALWYQRAGDDAVGSYYSFNGKSLRRAFLRSPLEFSRITSGFGGRMHPIMRDWRQHKGVDFAAPTGTHVRATSDGVVKFAGTQRGYGNSIELEHRGNVTTLYAHLHGFAPGVRKGAKVRQGDLIGYVGSTGWSTGPHLHYEFRVKGEHVNPMTVALPEATPIDGPELPRFNLASSVSMHRLSLAAQIVPSRAQ